MKKNHVPQSGPYHVLMPEIIKFLTDWQGPWGIISESDLNRLAWIAIEPKKLMYTPQTAIQFAAKYVLAPDLVPAFLTMVRNAWFRPTTKQASIRVLIGSEPNGKDEWIVSTLKDRIPDITVNDVGVARRDLRRRAEMKLPEAILKKLSKS